MSIGENIKRCRTARGMTLDDVARSVGVSRQTMSRYETGVISNIPSDKIEKIACALDVTPSKIMGWLPVIPTSACDLPSNAIPFAPSTNVAPILGRIPAGYPVLTTSEIIGYAPIDYPDAEDYFWLSVNGDSMLNAGIHTGDLVLIRRQDCADDGQIVAARVNGDEATLKRFRRVGNTVMLVPENPKFTPIPVPASAFDTGDASIIGVAVELKRRFV